MMSLSVRSCLGSHLCPGRRAGGGRLERSRARRCENCLRPSSSVTPERARPPRGHQGAPTPAERGRPGARTVRSPGARSGPQRPPAAPTGRRPLCRVMMELVSGEQPSCRMQCPLQARHFDLNMATCPRGTVHGSADSPRVRVTEISADAPPSSASRPKSGTGRKPG